MKSGNEVREANVVTSFAVRRRAGLRKLPEKTHAKFAKFAKF